MFKPGDILICVDASNSSLIENEKYTVRKVDGDTILLFDTFLLVRYYNWRFVLDIKSIRKEKLNKICSKKERK